MASTERIKPWKRMAKKGKKRGAPGGGVKSGAAGVGASACVEFLKAEEVERKGGGGDGAGDAEGTDDKKAKKKQKKNQV